MSPAVRMRSSAEAIAVKRTFVFMVFYFFVLNPDHCSILMTGIAPSPLYIHRKKLFICLCHATWIPECKLLRFLLRRKEIWGYSCHSAAAAGNQR
jgi:hypothetical protein